MKRQTTLGVAAFFYFLLLSVGAVSAQTLHVGKGNNGNGGVRFEALEFGAGRFPITLTILFHNGRITINETKLTFIIEKLNTEGASPEVIFVRVPQGRNWLNTDHSFVSSGEYRITAFDPDNKTLANTTISIKAGELEAKQAVATQAEVAQLAAIADSVAYHNTISEQPKIDLTPRKGEQMPDDERKLRLDQAMGDTAKALVALSNGVEEPLTAEDIATMNFDAAKLSFGTGILKEKLAGEATEFGFDAKGRYVQIMLDNGMALGTDRLIIDVWMRQSADTDFDQHVGRREVGINPKMKNANFHFSFFKQGDHKVSVYTRNMVWVCNGYLSIR